MQIASHTFSNQVILAPMAGVTDLPYRNLCRELGAGAVVGEMLSSKLELWESPKSRFRQIQKSEQGIRWIQILGNDPLQMATAARLCQEEGAHIIDINMGCPAKKVCKKAAGSALLQDEKLVEQILKTVVKAVEIPVTLKIRTGWNRENKNALAIANIAEQSGIAALSVHGRTRQCNYTLPAEHDTIAKIKQLAGIPIIVNGDITSAKKAQSVLDHTKADGIMVGRAALGNPWLFREIDNYVNHKIIISAPGKNELQQTIIRHIKALHDFYGSYLGVRIARKHLSWYEETFPEHIALKNHFNQINDCQEQLDLLEAYFSGFNDHLAVA